MFDLEVQVDCLFGRVDVFVRIGVGVGRMGRMEGRRCEGMISRLAGDGWELMG